MNLLEARAVGALAGAAVGDALGGATEGCSVEQIRARYDGPVTGIVEAFFPQHARPMSPYHKGDGRVTDDTLMTDLMVSVYDEKRDHLDAYDIDTLLVPRLMNEKVWIPEFDRESVPVLRLFHAEKWIVARLFYGHVDPREAGVGNVVNCGAAMYAAPTGIANAGNPRGAYQEAIDWSGAHQSSYGREAAGVFAAAVAASMTHDASVSSIIDAALSVAHDGTRQAIEAVCERAATLSDPINDHKGLRDAVRPFDTVGDHFREPGLAARRPSRLHTIEELPVALGLLVITGGDYPAAVLGGVNYGRDSDSIATMAGALAGALDGLAAIPQAWRDGVEEGSRLDLTRSGRIMADVAAEIHARDRQRASAAIAAFQAITVRGE